MLAAFRKDKYDRAHVLMSAGVSIFVCASLVLITPRLGVVFVEILIGLFLIGCAFISRKRFSRAAVELEGESVKGENVILRTRFIDRYDLLLVVGVLLFQITTAGRLQKAGWSEASLRILPLVFFGIGILLKRPLSERITKWKRRRASRVGEMTRPTDPPDIEESIDEKIYRQ